jgi:hypothetical protein
MERHIVDEETGISYTLQGDYYIPDFTLPPEGDTRPIGVWGMRHRDYLKNHRKAIYSIMLMDNTLHSYLADINEQADEMFNQLVKDMAKSEGITEQLKAENQMLWVQKMNNIRNRAMEIVNSELIYV